MARRTPDPATAPEPAPEPVAELHAEPAPALAVAPEPAPPPRPTVGGSYLIQPERPADLVQIEPPAEGVLHHPGAPAPVFTDALE